MPLTLLAGHATRAGQRAANEDFVGMVLPREPELSSKGFLAAVADGVSGNDGGREASEYTIRGLLSDYYATSDTWPVTESLDRVIKAINSWVQHQGSIRAELAGMATTLTSLVLRGHYYYFAHVGDTRLYLLRGDTLTLLTADHVWDRPEMQHVLTRAIGLDSRLAIDHGMGSLQEGDLFLLATDGVWDTLSRHDLHMHLSALREADSAEHIANQFLDAALEAGAQDNVSAMVIRVDKLPEMNLRDALSESQQLPLPPKLKPGQVIDGYTVEEAIHASAATLLYRVHENAEAGKPARTLVLKTLHPDRQNDAQERSAFAHEEWLARRVVGRFFPQVISPAQKNHLYYLTTWHEGSTLQQQLDVGKHFTVPDVLTQGAKLVRAVAALHRRSIIHRDIKPANVHIGSDGELRILDLGVAQSGLEEEDEIRAPRAGTPSYLAPEQFSDAPASRETDLYAVGVTLYQLLTRHFPYGEIEPFQTPRFGAPVAPSRYRPDVPMWLENVLLKAVAREPKDRFETAEEFLLALERGAARPIDRLPSKPLVERNPVSVWKTVAICAVVLNVLLLYLLVVR